MRELTAKHRALFLSTDGNIYPDTLICSGVIPAEFEGKECPFSEDGRMPESITLNANDPTYTIDKGYPGDLCPPCVKQQLGHLGHWQGHGKQLYPDDLLPLRLFKCNQWFWVVVLGLYHENPTLLSPH